MGEVTGFVYNPVGPYGGFVSIGTSKHSVHERLRGADADG
jgi:hypothetical protein